MRKFEKWLVIYFAKDFQEFCDISDEEEFFFVDFNGNKSLKVVIKQFLKVQLLFFFFTKKIYNKKLLNHKIPIEKFLKNNLPIIF